MTQLSGAEHRVKLTMTIRTYMAALPKNKLFSDPVILQDVVWKTGFLDQTVTSQCHPLLLPQVV